MLSKWSSIWIRGGKINEVAWIDKEIMVWSSGVHIIFFNVIKKLQNLWRCPENVDGAYCISTYPQLHLIALCENCLNARILILTYPTMEIISECAEGSDNGYLATAFAPPEYLISLASFPDYKLIVWNWRTGKQVYSVNTFIHDLENQMIRISPSKPSFIAQLGKDSGKLMIWSLNPSTCTSLCDEIILPKKAIPVHIDWSPHQENPLLAITDEFGHVYLSNKNGSEISRIIFSQRCATCLDYEVPAVSWFQNGILLKTTFCQMKFYSENGNKWHRHWYIKTPLKPYILSPHPYRKNILFFFTYEGDIVQLSPEMKNSSPKVETIFDYGSSFKFIDLIYPWAEHVVAIDDSKNLRIIDSRSGGEISRSDLGVDGEILYLISSLDYPLITFTTSAGELCLLSIYNCKKPLILRKYKFEIKTLDFLKYSQCGRHLITGRRRYGTFYCITSIEKEFNSIKTIETEHRIVDMAFFDTQGVLTIIMLIFPFKRAKAGNCMLIYKLPPDEDTLKKPMNVLKLPFLYDQLRYGININTLAASPFSSRKVHLFNIKDDQIHLTNIMEAPHKIRGIKVQANRNWIVTHGFDGIVGILKDSCTSQSMISVNSHHRGDMGVTKAVFKPSGDLLVCLGCDGSLICLKLQETDHSFSQSSVELNKEIIEMLTGTFQVIPPEDSGLSNWTLWQKRQKELKEEEQCRTIKATIIGDFHRLTEAVKKLIDENDSLPEDEKLTISAFDMDMIEREQKIKSAKEEREDRRQELEFQCSQLETVADWIRKAFWNSQSVKQQSIFSIFGNTEVTNFPSVPEDPQQKEMIRWLELFTEIDKMWADCGTEPRGYTLLKKRYLPNPRGKKSFIESIFDEDDEDAELEKQEEMNATAGLTTSRFIEPASQFFQFQRYKAPEILQLNNFLIADVQSLRRYFNQLFNEAFAFKERAMSSVCEIVSHIRFIDSELRLMFNSSVEEIPTEPHWLPKETPEAIIHTTDAEVSVLPYISPSQEEILRKHNEEQERIRQLMLSDDFRRRALMEMMDGVLEVRWEDIIKKDIPPPEFMEFKKPEDFTKEEIALVFNWEKEVQNLRIERERYRGILEATYTKKKRILHETVEKFNTNLQQLFIVKMKIESAICQLQLMRGRGYLRILYRIEMFEKSKEIEERISKEEVKNEKIILFNRVLQETLTTLKSQREGLESKEKSEKKFKTEFPSLGKAAVEFLRKQYKKRPKFPLKSATPGDILVLAKCVITHDNSSPLLPDYKNYLASLEALDAKPEDLPESALPQHWEHLVKIRRHRIELELKLKANSTAIEDLEKIKLENDRKIGKCKEIIASFENDWKKVNQDHQDFIKNMEIQLVLKMGQMEISLQGNRSDTDNSQLILIDIIHRMNEEILNAGEIKIKAMEHLIAFKRGNLFKEWEHKAQQMKLQDLHEELCEIKNILVTKQMQEILRRQAAGLREGKTIQDLEREIEAMVRSIEKSVNDWVLKIESVEKLIEARKRENDEFDKKITKMNVDRWEMELKRNLEGEEQFKEFNERKMKMISQRAKLCRKIQKAYADVLQLKIETALLTMRKYPDLPGCQVVELKENKNSMPIKPM